MGKPVIPFNLSSVQGHELKYIRKAVEIGCVAGDQKFSRKCQEFLKGITGCRHALVTTSCTHALAAFLYGQLEKWRESQAKRRAIWERYDAGLVE